MFISEAVFYYSLLNIELRYIHIYIFKILLKYTIRAAERAFKEEGVMKIKRAVSNFLVLISPGGTTTVCTGDKFLEIQVTRLAKIWLSNTLFGNLLSKQTNFTLSIFTK